jgi:hypothetical protein
MKTAIRLALLALATSSVSAFAQDVPQCAALFDSSANMFTAKDAPAGATNRQCFLTVLPKDGAESLASFPRLASYPSPQIQEGTYEILLSGGGGGGGAGGMLDSGGGGAGAVPAQTTQYLTPGIYKLTIGTSGKGGSNGGNGGDGNPTSVTRAYTNETIAGFSGADRAVGTPAGTSSNPNDGRVDSSGGRGVDNRGAGGAGGHQPDKNGNGEIASQPGGMMRVANVTTGTPGMGGLKDGGGGGGAGYGDGGKGNAGDQAFNRDLGNQGGSGFVRLSPIQIAQATPAPVAVAAPVAPAPAIAPARAARKDRN